MNKLIKTCIVGGIVYAMCDTAYQFGKGHVLGVLAKMNMPASQCIDAISDDKRPRVKFVKMVAEKVMREEL